MSYFSKTIFAGLAMAAASISVSVPTASAQDAMIGEVRDFGFTFCPRGWAETRGQLLEIRSNEALFSLLGTTYGGDGRTTFALPDLRSTASPRPAEQPKGGEVRVHQHCGFTGWSQSLGLGEYKAGEFGARSVFVDNDASSLQISEGWEVELFDGPDLTGSSVTLTGEESCLVGRDFNDKASSMIVRRSEKAPAPVAAASHRDKLKTCIAIMGIYPSRG